MKFILFLLLLFPINCKAEERYNDYYFYEETENYYEETNLLKREERKVYLNYKNNVSEEGYYPLGEEPDNLIFKDEEDYIIVDDDESNKSTYLYIDNHEYIKYIKLLNFNGDLTKINYFLTRDNDKNAAWDLQHINCYLKEIVNSESIILLKLRNTYYYENFKMIIAILSTSETDFSFDLGISEDNITYKYFHINIPNENLNNEHVFNLTNIEEEAGLKYENSITLYKYYNLEKAYTDIYTEKPLPNHSHNLTKFKTIYTYYKRDKKEKEKLENEIKNNIIEPSLNTNNLINEKETFAEENTPENLNEQLKLKNTTNNQDDNELSLIEDNSSKEEEIIKKEKNKLNFNFMIIFIAFIIIKSLLKKKEII